LQILWKTNPGEIGFGRPLPVWLKADKIGDYEQERASRQIERKNAHICGSSNTSPYAAAGAMGAVMGRSQALGPYFHFSAKRISGVQAEPAPGAVGELAPSNLSVDFIGDWSEFLRQKGMAVCGLKYDQSRTLEENTMRYLNAHNRRIPSTARRAVHESRELSVPQEYEPDYIALKSLISSGGDLKPYLSRDVLKKKRPDKNDALLNAWGIQHLHFSA
jgi:hypothetical protein